jgi:hypothetical protein
MLSLCGPLGKLRWRYSKPVGLGLARVLENLEEREPIRSILDGSGPNKERCDSGCEKAGSRQKWDSSDNNAYDYEQVGRELLSQC